MCSQCGGVRRFRGCLLFLLLFGNGGSYNSSKAGGGIHGNGGGGDGAVTGRAGDEGRTAHDQSGQYRPTDSAWDAHDNAQPDFTWTFGRECLSTTRGAASSGPCEHGSRRWDGHQQRRNGGVKSRQSGYRDAKHRRGQCRKGLFASLEGRPIGHLRMHSRTRAVLFLLRSHQGHLPGATACRPHFDRIDRIQQSRTTGFVRRGCHGGPLP
mmetsp:Transcript_23112/g.66737  ORF Transcript_23112/g.66737 Transcript_23112/m.66737 type:complete len:210 (-) Transcript_23112:65-694(-)